jgi:choline dehydrogenase
MRLSAIRLTLRPDTIRLTTVRSDYEKILNFLNGPWFHASAKVLRAELFSHRIRSHLRRRVCVSIAARFPVAVDTVVVGAGTAGAVVAGRLAAGSSGRTLLVEAGPDYGPADSGRWPHDLLDATSAAPWSHDWGYAGEFGGQVIHFNRARVVGGCSAHNAGAVVLGSRFDYDGWAGAGNPGWSARELLPLFAAAWDQLRVRRVGLDELTPFQRVCRDAIAATGIPAVEDFNDLGQDAGVAPFPVNIDGVTRVNSAFGYVDPVRDRLMVAGDTLVERVLVRHGRAAGVAVRDGGRLAEIGASRVVLSAGAYGSPAILLRSGIGPAGELAAVEVEPALDRVHGIEGLYVADASLMPAVTSGNTNMPTAVIGERIARSLLGSAQPGRA